MIDYRGASFDLDWFPKLDLNFDGKIDIMIPSPKVAGVNIYFDASECEATKRIVYGFREDEIAPYLDHYDIIVTNSILYQQMYPKKCAIFPFGNLWVRETSPIKEGSISFMTSAKSGADGYALRHEIYHKAEELLYQKRFYESRIPIAHKYPPLPQDQKKFLFDSAFSLVVENHKQKYWFTEKLIDCLWSKTLPIYYGCTNIEDYFDTRGMILFNDFEELKDIVSKLTYDDYLKRIPFIEENYNRCQQFCEIKHRLEKTINDKLHSNFRNQ